MIARQMFVGKVDARIGENLDVCGGQMRRRVFGPEVILPCTILSLKHIAPGFFDAKRLAGRKGFPAPHGGQYSRSIIRSTAATASEALAVDNAFIVKLESEPTLLPTRTWP
jgi:hypothetical protein